VDQQVTVREDDLLFTLDDGIGRVTFNRPQARNAFTFEMYERLAEICERANRDQTIKVLLLRGSRRQGVCRGHRHQPVPSLQDAAGRARL
jgi:enoyl-CoA hydratase